MVLFCFRAEQKRAAACARSSVPMGWVARAALRLRRVDASVYVLSKWVALYYATNVVYVTSSKHVLLDLPTLPWSLSCCHWVVAVVCSKAWFACTRPHEDLQPVSPRQWRLVAAGTVTCWLGFACANVACAVMNASLVETIKATSPVPQVLIAVFLCGEALAPVRVLSALFVIVVGVGMASYADATACFRGLVATVFMNLNFAASDNIVKFSYQLPDKLDSTNMWYRTAHVSLVFSLPVAIVEIFLSGVATTGAQLGPEVFGSVALYAHVLLGGASFFLYNQAICELLHLVPVSTFAVLGSVRRALTIVALTVHFGTEVTRLNIAGFAVVGLGFVLFLAHGERATGTQNSKECSPSQPMKPVLPEHWPKHKPQQLHD